MGSMTNDQLKNAILAWWAQHRPLSFSLDDHVANPTVNLSSDADKELGRVAGWIAKDY